MCLVLDAATTVILMLNASGSRPQLSSARLWAPTRVLSTRFGPSTSLPFQPGYNYRTWRGSNISVKALVQPEYGWFARKISPLPCQLRLARNPASQTTFLLLIILPVLLLRWSSNFQRSHPTSNLPTAESW